MNHDGVGQHRFFTLACVQMRAYGYSIMCHIIYQQAFIANLRPHVRALSKLHSLAPMSKLMHISKQRTFD